MSTSSDGMGGTGPGPVDHAATARANAAQPFGTGALLGARGDRDVTRPDPASIAPPAPPATRWAPPRQPCGNAKGKRL